jgi:hypothetical protein
MRTQMRRATSLARKRMERTALIQTLMRLRAQLILRKMTKSSTWKLISNGALRTQTLKMLLRVV